MGRKRLSDWTIGRPKGAPLCQTCEGTGDSGRRNAKGETIVCPDCHGFGY